MKPPGAGMGRKAAVLGIGALLIAVHYLIFSQFFPNANGKLGHDHAIFLPYLLDGYYWYDANGIRSIPWFTPSFCGGVPRFANRYQFYSVPQFLTFVIDPVASIRLTLAIFGSIGFWGFYLLLRRVFRITAPTALLGATLFLFNGFFAHRLIIGHLEYHAFMLIPFIAFFQLRPIPGAGSAWWWRWTFDIVMAGMMIAYLVVTGLTYLPIPTGMMLLVFGLTLAIVERGAVRFRDVVGRFVGSIALGGALGAAKLAAGMAFLRNMPREFYPLPGVASVLDILRLLAASLFWAPPHDAGNELLLNTPWLMGRHEFEYGVTWIPVALLIVGLLLRTPAHGAGSRRRRLRPTDWACIGGLVVLLLTPIALNYYTPQWNRLLKTIPIIKHSSQNIRFFSIYIPTVILASTLIFDRITAARRLHLAIVAAGIAGVVTINALTDRTSYHSEHYDPNPVLDAYARTRKGDWSPVISHIEVRVDSSGTYLLPLDRNDSLTRGFSQLMCDEAMFGYRLERFPRKTLRPGRVLNVEGGRFNLKNPACYLFPAENDCLPGDHFRTAQRDDAVAFVHFRPITFTMSTLQKAANVVSGAALVAVVAFLVLFGGKIVARRTRTRLDGLFTTRYGS